MKVWRSEREKERKRDCDKVVEENKKKKEREIIKQPKRGRWTKVGKHGEGSFILL